MCFDILYYFPYFCGIIFNLYVRIDRVLVIDIRMLLIMLMMKYIIVVLLAGGIYHYDKGFDDLHVLSQIMYYINAWYVCML